MLHSLLQQAQQNERSDLTPSILRTAFEKDILTGSLSNQHTSRKPNDIFAQHSGEGIIVEEKADGFLGFGDRRFQVKSTEFHELSLPEFSLPYRDRSKLFKISNKGSGWYKDRFIENDTSKNRIRLGYELEPIRLLTKSILQQFMMSGKEYLLIESNDTALIVSYGDSIEDARSKYLTTDDTAMLVPINMQASLFESFKDLAYLDPTINDRLQFAPLEVSQTIRGTVESFTLNVLFEPLENDSNGIGSGEILIITIKNKTSN